MIEFSKTNNPSHVTCVGIIMDGNRRWAAENNLPVYEGHSEGYKKLKEVVHWSREAGIPHMVIYAFSTENWKRSEKEVGYLITLFRFILENETKKMVDERVRVRFIGDMSRFSEDIKKLMEYMEKATAVAYDITLHLAMSYGGRAEIVAAVNLLIAEGRTSTESFITEEIFAQKLWSRDMPDPDLIIRTGGESRLSNFLSWQSIYSELFFTDTKWPAFTKEEFNAILAEFSTRERRGGK
jgi:undecaprenyl diphosphate synthase